MMNSPAAGFAASISDGGALPNAAFVDPDLPRLGFGAEFGHGVWVGTQVTQTLRPRNLGLQPLTVSAVIVEGADANFFSAHPAFVVTGDRTQLSLTSRRST